MTATQNSNLATVIPLDTPEVRALSTQRHDLSEHAFTIRVQGQTDYELAMQCLALLAGLDKKADALFKPIKQSIDASKKVVLDREKAERDPIKKAMAYLREEINGYLDSERKKAEEQARREQIKAVETAERERQRLLNRAVKAEDKGLDDKAEELLAQAEEVYVAPVVVQAINGVTEHGHTQTEVDVDVLDMDAFIAELVARKLSAAPILKAQVAPLKAFVKSLNLKEFPGLSIKRAQKVRVKSL